MAGLAQALARRGWPVTYVAEEPMSAERAAQGWTPPTLDALSLRFAPDAASASGLAAEAPEGSIHICQGLRGNGMVNAARLALGRAGHRQWVVMETVQEHGQLATLLKRLEYARLVRSARAELEGILAIGHATPRWLMARGMPAEAIGPFAYFLPDVAAPPPTVRPASAPFRILFVGRLIELKRIDTLIAALAQLVARVPARTIELVVVGSGPLEAQLRAAAAAALGTRVDWRGSVPMAEVPSIMAAADCLVLPSRHDGWGAVVSEALMAGTPVLCSTRCGAAGVVAASGQGGVFPPGDVAALAAALQRLVAAGPLPSEARLALRRWATCLGASAGAAYLEAILTARAGAVPLPAPPWLNHRS